MKNLIIFGLLLHISSVFVSTSPSIETLTVADTASNQRVIVSTSFDGWEWALVKVVDNEAGALFVTKSQNGQSKTIGGDSSPFPLSRYGLPTQVVSALADLYVEHEIKTTPGGVEVLKQRVSQYNKIPHDLKDAYSKYMEVNALATYVADNMNVRDMIQILNEASKLEESPKFRKFEAQKLNYSISHIIIQIAEKPSEELIDSLFKAVLAHPKHDGLQEALAVGAGRHPKIFGEQWRKLKPPAKSKIVEAIQNALNKKLIGGKVAESAKHFISQSSGN